ncbi:sulfite exporter TauE/SafE family protein [Noviherbaspirillum pedocola]|uniref:Probable membrane transporter protein n=1 Tax=Noviherbaspirillum pedocola TaxID=2801341 RepID=A0A934T0B8_9BURK|nr:sulfite exporter TauE/SafE family protein [Noviherbaspirillum pedocola]MBK4735038.1 sulfite exporter TauE/SafE family protein [Noviherbaspirillum pedocola]
MTLYLLLGLATGAILALTGAGGGILAVPLLVFGAGMSMAQAGPIGLLAVGMAAGLGAVIGLKKRVVRYRAALLIAGAGMLLSPLGLWLAARVDNRGLTLLFAMVLAIVAYRGFRKAGGSASQTDAGARPPPCVRDTASGRFIWTRPCARALTIAGGIAGLLSGLLGVGGGFVMVPALRRYTDLSMDATIATSLAVIALVSASGVASSIAAQRLEWAAALPFCAGALAGMTGGRFVAERMASAHTQRAFAAVAAMVALGMVLKTVLPLLR